MKKIYLGIIFSSIFLLFFIIFLKQSSCRTTSEEFCNYLSSQSFEQVTGEQTTTIFNQTDSSTKTSFSIQKNVTELVLRQGTVHLLSAYIDSQNAYLFDPTQPIWFKQPISQFQTYQESLPFLPTIFFDEFMKKFSSEDVQVISRGIVGCGYSRCQAYLVASQDHEDVLYFDLDTKLLKKIETSHGKDSYSISLEYKTEELAQPDKSLSYTKNGNLVLEIIQNSLSNQKKTIPEYVKEFETQAEQTSDIQFQSSGSR